MSISSYVTMLLSPPFPLLSALNEDFEDFENLEDDFDYEQHSDDITSDNEDRDFDPHAIELLETITFSLVNAGTPHRHNTQAHHT